MKVKQFFTKRSQEFLKAYKEKNGVPYRETFGDNIPKYELVDDDLKPVIRESKSYNADTEKIEITKIPVVFTQAQLNHNIKIGQQIEIITDESIVEKASQENALKDLIENAKFEAVEAYKKEQAELLKKVSKEVKK